MGAFHEQSHPRKPAGHPGGGRFTETNRPPAHPDVTLTGTNTHRDDQVLTLGPVERRGVRTVIDTTRKPVLMSDTHTIKTVTRYRGHPELKAWGDLVALRAERSNQDDTTAAKVAHLAAKRSKATLLVHYRANGTIRAHEGTLTVDDNDRPILLNKGSATEGMYVDDPALSVIDVTAGYGASEPLTRKLNWYATDVPELGQATFDHLPAHGADTDQVAAIYILTDPSTTDGRGTVLFATGHTPTAGDGNEGTVHGYAITPNGPNERTGPTTMDEATIRREGGIVPGVPPGTYTIADATAYGNLATQQDDIETCWADLRRHQTGP